MQLRWMETQFDDASCVIEARGPIVGSKEYFKLQQYVDEGDGVGYWHDIPIERLPPDTGTYEEIKP